ncbi:MAG: hypothetical protein OXJ52_03450 [Oligoflexia bacterium]|nr:hypothetical protein [Oligoflexia bacterium]
MRLFQKTSFLYWSVAFTLVFVIAHFIHEKFVFDKPGNYFTSSHYKPYPYIMFKKDRDYRGPVPAKVKEKGEFRIFILGGSSVRGGKAPFSIYLEQIFHKQGYEKDVAFELFKIITATKLTP